MAKKRKKGCNWVECTAKSLVLLGALNLGLVASFGFDLLGTVLGRWGLLLRIVYILVGASALYRAWQWYNE